MSKITELLDGLRSDIEECFEVPADGGLMFSLPAAYHRKRARSLASIRRQYEKTDAVKLEKNDERAEIDRRVKKYALQIATGKEITYEPPMVPKFRKMKDCHDLA